MVREGPSPFPGPRRMRMDVHIGYFTEAGSVRITGGRCPRGGEAISTRERLSSLLTIVLTQPCTDRKEKPLHHLPQMNAGEEI
jgi:hypothetical protein